MSANLDAYEYPCDRTKFLVAGVDEAGRGPLCGNVVAACVVLDVNQPVAGLNDSKKLSPAKREALYSEIVRKALAVGVGMCTPAEIDAMNILRASLEAMRRAYQDAGLECAYLLVDGNREAPVPGPRQICVVGGDAKVAEIAAASIIAKVTRDRQMLELDRLHPQYGFAAHKGYPTAEHLRRLETLPLLPCYRKSYGPVKRLLAARGEG